MSRLFIGQREADFISDITKEIIKDVAGQKIYLYSVREDLSNVHNVYEESDNKIFDNPIELEALVEWQQSDVKSTKFGVERIQNVVANIHIRDIIDRNININMGDFFSFGEYFFEITNVYYDKLVYGQVDRFVSLKVSGKQARKSVISQIANGPTSEEYSDIDSIQTHFEQQRGETFTDKRQLREDNVLPQKHISEPNKVTNDGTSKSINGVGSSFYGDK